MQLDWGAFSTSTYPALVLGCVQHSKMNQKKLECVQRFKFASELGVRLALQLALRRHYTFFEFIRDWGQIEFSAIGKWTFLFLNVMFCVVCVWCTNVDNSGTSEGQNGQDNAHSLMDFSLIRQWPIFAPPKRLHINKGNKYLYLLSIWWLKQ